jgi:hypothetical protein
MQRLALLSSIKKAVFVTRVWMSGPFGQVLQESLESFREFNRTKERLGKLII